jgi:ribosomal protein S18 acetylase RimI-like enzyme
VSYPIDVSSLPQALEFATSKAYALCDDEGDVVAFGQLVRKDAGRRHLARLIVNPVLRGQGHGETLARGLIERARRDGCGRISLNVDVANTAATALYLKIGFADAVRPLDEPESPGTRYMETGR